MEINRRDFITKVSAIAALSVLPSSFVAAMGNEKVEKAKPKYPTLKCDAGNRLHRFLLFSPDSRCFVKHRPSGGSEKSNVFAACP